MEAFFQSCGSRAGTYTLVMELDRDAAISIGRLGRRQFPAGFYTYTGSAFGPGGLQARIGRHLKNSKKRRWHIDYLRRFAEIREIWYTFHPEKVECCWAEIIQRTRSASIPCSGFGSSDCECDTHLFYFKRKPGIKTFRNKIELPISCKGFQSWLNTSLLTAIHLKSPGTAPGRKRP